MPQSERAEIMKKLLKWLISLENTEAGGTTHEGFHAYTQWEICEGGATTNTIRKYKEDLIKNHLIEFKSPFLKITNAGRQWLERHSV